MTEMKTVAVEDLAPEERVLNAHDRCDACGHAAAVAVDLEGSELLFCGHHYVKSEASLAALGAGVTGDRRSEIK